jgi:hypothetical protein
MWKEARSVEERLRMLKEARDLKIGRRGSIEAGGLKGTEGAEHGLDRMKG